jgi:hypothetical protein
MAHLPHASTVLGFTLHFTEFSQRPYEGEVLGRYYDCPYFTDDSLMEAQQGHILAQGHLD